MPTSAPVQFHPANDNVFFGNLPPERVGDWIAQGEAILPAVLELLRMRNLRDEKTLLDLGYSPDHRQEWEVDRE